VANKFPPIWFETFLSPEVAAPVERELEFIQSYLPVATFPRVLDIPCGIGRHSGPLSSLGYDVLGIDRSATALAVAKGSYPGVEFQQGDMFALGSGLRTVDGVLCLWQSFGYGDSDENQALLQDMCGWLRPGGRLLMDIYNADCAETLPRDATDERGGRTVSTKRSFSDGRLRVELQYSDSGETDVHDWEIYRPDEFQELAETVGLEALLRCAWFDPAIPPSAEHLRMQFLLERAE